MSSTFVLSSCIANDSSKLVFLFQNASPSCFKKSANGQQRWSVQYSLVPHSSSLRNTIFNIFNTTREHSVKLGSHVDGVDFDGLHAAEDQAFDALASLVQSFEFVPLSLLRLGTRRKVSATVDPFSQSLKVESIAPEESTHFDLA